MTKRKRGKYDETALDVAVETQANMVLLIVLGGRKGSGFSVVTATPEGLTTVPTLLRDLAKVIENGDYGRYDRDA